MQVYNIEGMPQTQISGIEALFWGGSHQEDRVHFSPSFQSRATVSPWGRQDTRILIAPAPSGRSSIPGRWGRELLSSPRPTQRVERLLQAQQAENTGLWFYYPSPSGEQPQRPHRAGERQTSLNQSSWHIQQENKQAETHGGGEVSIQSWLPSIV